MRTLRRTAYPPVTLIAASGAVSTVLPGPIAKAHPSAASASTVPWAVPATATSVSIHDPDSNDSTSGSGVRGV